MIDRISRTTIDETGRQSGKPDADLTIHFPASGLEPVSQSQITAAANEHGFYGDDQVRFLQEVDNATEFLIRRVAASGGDKRRFRDRRSRKRLITECMANAGVPRATWTDWVWRVLTLGSYVAPPPWNIVIAAVMLAVERYLGGQP